MPKQAPVVTIDGLSGVGKGTVCQLLATKMGWQLLDSGAIYRVLALAAAHHNVQLDNEADLAVLAAHLDIHFNPTGSLIEVVLEGEEVTRDIRTQECASSASKIATLPRVRESLLRRQRAFRRAPGLVADGRDMGTVVFPNAEAKIFLEASAEERANRRCVQLKQMGVDVSIRQIIAEICERDERDAQRKAAPCIAADDALKIDTTGMNIEHVFDKILMHVVTCLGQSP